MEVLNFLYVSFFHKNNQPHSQIYILFLLGINTKYSRHYLVKNFIYVIVVQKFI